MLILAGLALGAAWVHLLSRAPIEEPAALERTPNPSVTPWYDSDHEEAIEESRRARLNARLVLYGFPSLALAFIVLGILVQVRRPRRDVLTK